MDCVVAIGVLNDKGEKAWVGTGFLFGKHLSSTPDGQKHYKVYLVTNKHVLKGQSTVLLRFNPQSGQAAKDYNATVVDGGGLPKWTGHPNDQADVAVLQVNATILQNEGMKFSFFRSDEGVLRRADMIAREVTEGDSAFVLGFPMGLMAVDHQYVILRSGALARVRDFLDSRSDEYIIDVQVFPGNSGGPVILKPELASIEGTKNQTSAGLIGLVKSYIPYRDVAISQQTGRPRVIFEENSGLSLVEPVDHILQAIDTDELRKQPVTPAAEPEKVIAPA